MANLFKYLLDLTYFVAQLGSWLTTPLDFINITPLEFFTVGGFGVILVLHIIHLVV